jgi:hypothetical protein
VLLTVQVYVLYDIAEFADACGCESMDVWVDNRQHGQQSLLHSGLAEFQVRRPIDRSLALLILIMARLSAIVCEELFAVALSPICQFPHTRHASA